MEDAQQLREKMFRRLPGLKDSGKSRVPNSRFWDYYNAGGKERLREAGIVLHKEGDTWYVKLRPQTPTAVEETEEASDTPHPVIEALKDVKTFV